MPESKKVFVCFGPGPQFKGGISNYNTSLAKALAALGHEVHIVSWTQQYPALIPRDFIDRASKKDMLEGTGIHIHYLTNYNNPFTWLATVRLIASLKPKCVIMQWAIALQGLPMGFIASRLKKAGVEVLMDTHVVAQKEASLIDNTFLKMGLGKAGGFIVHSLQHAHELKELFPSREFHLSGDGIRKMGKVNVLTLYHPVYDMFKPDPTFDVAHFKQDMGLRKHVFLFFGFIRKYKGLHQVIPAFAALAKKRQDVSLLIVGESFWNTLDNSKLSTRIKKALFGAVKSLLVKNSNSEEDYRPLELIKALGIEDRCVVVNHFVPNEDVHKYFQVSDCVVNFYETATPSGVESIAYNFNMPILATTVGHFPETIIPGFNGYLAESGNIENMTDVLHHFLDHPIDRNNVKGKVKDMSWEKYAKIVSND